MGELISVGNCQGECVCLLLTFNHLIWHAKEQSEISKSKGKELIQKSSQTLGECGCVVVWKKDC